MGSEVGLGYSPPPVEHTLSVKDKYEFLLLRLCWISTKIITVNIVCCVSFGDSSKTICNNCRGCFSVQFACSHLVVGSLYWKTRLCFLMW